MKNNHSVDGSRAPPPPPAMRSSSTGILSPSSPTSISSTNADVPSPASLWGEQGRFTPSVESNNTALWNQDEISAKRSFRLHELVSLDGYRGDEELQQVLEECNTEDIAIHNEEGELPIHIACRSGYASCIYFLQGYGASLEATTASGMNVIHCVCYAGEWAEECLNYLTQSCNILKTVNIDAVDDNGRTALHHAAALGNERLCVMLLDNGAAIFLKDSSGMSPREYATISKEEQCARLLERWEESLRIKERFQDLKVKTTPPSPTSRTSLSTNRHARPTPGVQLTPDRTARKNAVGSGVSVRGRGSESTERRESAHSRSYDADIHRDLAQLQERLLEKTAENALLRSEMDAALSTERALKEKIRAMELDISAVNRAATVEAAKRKEIARDAFSLRERWREADRAGALAIQELHEARGQFESLHNEYEAEVSRSRDLGRRLQEKESVGREKRLGRREEPIGEWIALLEKERERLFVLKRKLVSTLERPLSSRGCGSGEGIASGEHAKRDESKGITNDEIETTARDGRVRASHVSAEVRNLKTTISGDGESRRTTSSPTSLLSHEGAPTAPRQVKDEAPFTASTYSAPSPSHSTVPADSTNESVVDTVAHDTEKVEIEASSPPAWSSFHSPPASVSTRHKREEAGDEEDKTGTSPEQIRAVWSRFIENSIRAAPHIQKAREKNAEKRNALAKDMVEAVKLRDARAVERLVLSGAPSNLGLFEACRLGHSDMVGTLVDIDEELLEKSLDGTTDGRQTALVVSSFYGNTSCVRFLLGAGADPHSNVDFGETPLHVAAREGHIECVRLLLQYGARSDVLNKSSKTPLQVAAKAARRLVRESEKSALEIATIAAGEISVDKKKLLSPATLKAVERLNNLKKMECLLQSNDEDDDVGDDDDDEEDDEEASKLNSWLSV